MKITVGGDLGSGKSTIAKLLAKQLGYRHYSIGDLQRMLADEQGLSLIEWHKLEQKDPKYDRMIDDKAIEIGEKDDHFVMDGHLSFHFIPDSFKVFLKVDLDVGAKRIFSQKRDWEPQNTSLEVTKERLIKRVEINQKRWKEFYGVDHLDLNNYDLVIDTTSMTIKEVITQIIKNIEEK